MNIHGAAACTAIPAANACHTSITAGVEFACSSDLRVDVNGVSAVNRNTFAGGQGCAVAEDQVYRASYSNAAADGHTVAHYIPLAIFKSRGVRSDNGVVRAGVVAGLLHQRGAVPRHVGNGVEGRRRRSIPIYLNLFYTLTLIIATINGCAIYSWRLIFLRGFHYKWRFTVCCLTIGIVIKYTFGDGISISRGDGCRPTISPPSPVSEIC